MKEKNLLTPYISNLIKIIALLMMFCHHFLRTDSWVVGDNGFVSLFHLGGLTLESFLCDVGKLCVGIFAVLSGYGLYFSLVRDDSFKRIISRLIKFLINYWIVFFVIFTPCFFLVGNHISIKELIDSFLTINPTINMFSWYVHFYVIAVPMLWLYHKSLNKIQNKSTVLWITIILCFCMPFVNTGISCLIDDWLDYFPSMLTGYLFARYQLLDKGVLKIESNIAGLPQFFLGLSGGGVVLVMRFLVARLTSWRIYTQFDAVFAIAFVFCLLVSLRRISESYSRAVSKIGKATANMWYLHAIFFGAYAEKLQWIAYLPRYSFPVIIWVFCLLLPVALLIDCAVSGNKNRNRLRQ